MGPDKAWGPGIDLRTRGGVEDTRLEAKAKDTKKIRGQGQPFWGQTLSRPRTGMLEAKAKDQGHKRKCSPKKGLHKNFLSDLQKKKKKKRSSQKFFRRSPQKNVFQKNFQALHKILTIQKILLYSSRGQPIFEDLRPRGQGQGLQNVSSRPRTSSRTPSLLRTTWKNFSLRSCVCVNRIEEHSLFLSALPSLSTDNADRNGEFARY